VEEFQIEMEIGKSTNRLPVGLQPTDLFRGGSRDPFLDRAEFSRIGTSLVSDRK
jgi:hypothetical protein